MAPSSRGGATTPPCCCGATASDDALWANREAAKTKARSMVGAQLAACLSTAGRRAAQPLSAQPARDPTIVLPDVIRQR
eukprot:COSAG05_NODE_209_length_14039_cov_138.574892_14_plen_79_part_00